jgi:hypothetical protein
MDDLVVGSAVRGNAKDGPCRPRGKADATYQQPPGHQKRNILACGRTAQQQSHVRTSKNRHTCRDREDRPTDHWAVRERGSMSRRQAPAPNKVAARSFGSIRIGCEFVEGFTDQDATNGVHNPWIPVGRLEQGAMAQSDNVRTGIRTRGEPQLIKQVDHLETKGHGTE